MPEKSIAPSKPRKSFFDLLRKVEALGLRRGPHVVLLALATLVSRETLSTEQYPVTIARLEAKTRYKASAVFEHLKTLEEMGLIRRERRKRQTERGHWINAPTTYYLTFGEDVQWQVPEPRKTPPEPPRPSPALPPIMPPPRPIIGATMPRKHQQRSIADIELPIILEVQKPDGFAPDVVHAGDALKKIAGEIIADAKASANAITEPKIVAAWHGIVASTYSLGQTFVEARKRYYLNEEEASEAVSEWLQKAVLVGDLQHPLRYSARLHSFLTNKGRALMEVRMNVAVQKWQT